MAEWTVKETQPLNWTVKEAVPLDPNAPVAAPRKRTPGERFKDNFQEGVRGTLSGAAARALMSMGADKGGDLAAQRRAFDKGQNREEADAYRLISETDKWNQAPGGVLDKALAGVATLGGVLAGGITSPESLIGPGKTALARILANAGISGAIDAPVQGLQIKSGEIDRYDPVRTAMAVGTGGLIQSGFEAASPLARAAVKAIGKKIPANEPPPIETAVEAPPAPKAKTPPKPKAPPQPETPPPQDAGWVVKEEVEITPEAPPASERVDIGGEVVDQTVIPGAEASAQQAADARGPTMKPKAPQADPGGMFAPPEPVQPGLLDEPIAPQVDDIPIPSRAPEGVTRIQPTEAPPDPNGRALDMIRDRQEPILADELEPEVELAAALEDIAEYRVPNPQGYSLFKAIKDLGGIRTRDANGVREDVADLLDGVRRPGLINNKTGLSPEAMREALRDRGWFGEYSGDGPRFGDDVDDLYRLIGEEVAGNKVYHPERAAPGLEERLRDLDQEVINAGVTRADSPADAAAKLVKYRSDMRAANADLAARMEDMRETMDYLGLHPDFMSNAEILAAINAYFSKGKMPNGIAALKAMPNEPAGVARLRAMMSGGPVQASTKGGLREQPKPGAVQAPDPANLPRVAKSIGAISRDLIADLGVTARQGRLGMRGALGTYNTKSGVVRTQGMQELDVLSHEIGHAMEGRKLPSLLKALDAHAADLEPMAYPGANPQHLREEGFAEWFRWYLTNRTHAQKIAPGFLSSFEEALAKDAPDALAAMKKAQTAYQEFLNAPSAASAAASMVRPRTKSLLDSTKEWVANPIEATKSVAHELYRGWIDGLDPVKRAVDQLVKIKEFNTGAPVNLKVAEDPYKLLRSLPGAAQSGHMDIMHGVHGYHDLGQPQGPGLADALEVALGEKFRKWDEAAISEFDAYLAARRLVNEYDRYESGALSQPPDKFSREYWEQVIADLGGANPTWERAAQMVYDFNNDLWKKRMDAGLITEAQYLDGLANHEDYVPLFRDMSDRAASSGILASISSGTKRAGGVKRFRGSTRDYISPISSMMKNAYELNMLIARNDALKALDDLGQTAGPEAGSIVERLPARETEAIRVDAIEALREALSNSGISTREALELQAAVEAALGEEAPVKVYRGAEMNERGEPVVYVWRDGKSIPLRMPDGKFGQDMVTAVAGMSKPVRGLWLELAAIPARTLRYGITSHPSFFAANTFRDQLAASILTDVGYMPFFDQLRGLGSELSQGELTRAYNVLGGAIGGAQTAAEHAARFDRDIQALRKKGYAIRRFGNLDNPAEFVKGFAEFTELSETGTRLGVFDRAYKKARDRGLTDWEAGKEAEFEARDMMDFDRRGGYAFTQAATRIIPFLNASLQGLDKSRRVAGGVVNAPKVIKSLFGGAPANEAETRAFYHAMKAWASVAALGAAGLALRAAYRDDPEYQEVADYVRNSSWVVKLPNGEFLALPKPFDLAVLSNVMERAYEGIALKDPTAWDRLGEGMETMFSPPDSSPILTLPYQLAKNRDAFGQPIIPDHLRYGVEPQDQFSGSTSEFSKKIGDWLNISPAQIDHIIKGTGGSWARDVLKWTDKAVRKDAPVRGTPADTFVGSRFVKDWTRGSVSSKEFWNLVSGTGGEWEMGKGSVLKLMNAGRTDQAIERLQDMDAQARAYALTSLFISGQDKQVHPMIRAQESVATMSDLISDLRDGNIRGPDLQPVQLSREERTAAIKLLEKMSVAEKRNSLIDAGVKGWAQKEHLPMEQYEASLQSEAPAVAGALALRMGIAGVEDRRILAALWSELKPTLEQAPDEDGIKTLMSAKLGTGRGAVERFLRQVEPVQ